MKVLLLNGSPNVNGNTARALEEMRKIFEEEQIETEVIQIGSKQIRGCCACQSCYKTAQCVFDDEVNEIAKKFEECDGMEWEALYIMHLQMARLLHFWTDSSIVPDLINA